MGEEQHRIENLFLDPAPVEIAQLAGGREQRPEPLRVFGRHLFLPAPVIGPVENDVQTVLQSPLVGRLRQQAVTQNAPPFGKETGAGQDAAVGEEGDEATAGDEMHDVAAKRQKQVGIGLEAGQHRRVALARPGIAAISRAQYGNQPANQIKRIGRRVAERFHGFVQAGLRWLAAGRKPAPHAFAEGHAYCPAFSHSGVRCSRPFIRRLVASRLPRCVMNVHCWQPDPPGSRNAS